MLEDIKMLLGITGTELDQRLETILWSVEARLKFLLGGGEEIPSSLAYIVIEVSVARFNRIGSEGMASHSVEGESISYVDNDFAAYMDDIQTYLNKQEEAKRGRVCFL